MKANKILLAMALPVAFAACTSEEIIENAGNDLQSRRALPQITVSVEGDVDSRFSWNEANFGWNAFTANDKFGAGLVDGTPWTVSNNLYTNYIYSDAAGNGAFTTTSQMVEGVYFFYSYPGFESVAKRGTVAFDLTSQTSIDFEKPTAAVEANQLFVSALYKLDAATANEALPVKFYSYWSTAGLKLKNTSGAPIKIVRVMLKNAGDTPEKFEVKGTLDLTAMGTANKNNSKIAKYCYSYDATSGNYILGYKDASKPADGRVDESGFLTLDIANATISDEAMMLDCGKYELADGEEALAYFQVPAGNYKDLEVIVNVEVTEEDVYGDLVSRVVALEPIKVAKNAKSKADVAANDITTFKRGKTVALFGIANGAVAAEEIDDVDILAAGEAGFYAADYDDLSALVKENDVDFDVNNMGTLKIDDKVIRLMSSVDKVVTFKNPIEITTEKTSVVSLTNIKVTEAKVVKGKFAVAEDMEGDVTVNAGTELTVKSVQTGTVTNYGTVNLAVATAVKNVTSEAGVAYNSIVNIIGNVSVDEDVLVEEPATLKVSGTSSASVTATIDGELNVANLVVNAYGVVSDASKNLTITSSVENAGTITGTNLVGKQNADTSISWATASNSNVIDGMALNQYAKITNENSTKATAKDVIGYNDGSAITLGYINNTKDGFVSNAAAGTVVYVEYDGENKTGKLGLVQGCNKIILKNATWTKPELQTGVTDLELVNVTLTDGDNDTNETYDWTQLTGKVSITGTSVIKENVKFSGATEMNFAGATFELELNAGATNAKLASIKGATFNANTKLTGSSTAASLDMSGVTVAAGTLTLPTPVTTLTIGDAYETAYVTTINGIVTGKINTVDVKKGATLNIGLAGQIMTSGKVTLTNAGTVTVKNSAYSWK